MEASGSPILKLEGKLSGPWVDELKNCWKIIAHRTNRKGIKVDLQGVSYLDNGGRDLLLRMEREGASLVECSDFIRQLLNVKEARQRTLRKTTKKTRKEN
jgi:ABC-type transporter Mla MlaB component